MPTIFLLQTLHVFKTLFGLILVEVAFAMPFSVLVMTAFMGSIPREIDEAAVMDGAGTDRACSSASSCRCCVRPSSRSSIVSSVAIYNDFVYPLYFLPGDGNETAQLTLFNFQSQFNTQWNLLFADVLLITIPPFLVFLLFQRQIVSGFTAGAVKG